MINNEQKQQIDMPYQVAFVVLNTMTDSCSFTILAPIRLVCRQWKKIIDSSTFRAAEDEINERFIAVRRQIGAIIHNMFHEMFIYNDIRRLHLIENTLQYSDTVMKQKWPPMCVNRRESIQMMARLLRQFTGTVQLLSDINDGTEKMTTNFDVADMGLRRRIEELNTNSFIASTCIKDAHTRALWDTAFGSAVGEVSWSMFCKRFVRLANVKNKSTWFFRYLKTVMCFPEGESLRHSTVTPYAVHLLSALCGSGPDMWTNFNRLAIKNGFVGFVNVVGAEELFERIKGDLHVHSYFVRYSRTVPDVFTITTYNPSNNEIRHIRNINPTRPLPELIDQMNKSGWILAPCYPNTDIITSSALGYCRKNASAYYFVF